MAISAPTIINAADVTSSEITLTSGEKNKATTKQTAITTDVKPVFPPTAIPAEDSTLVAGVDVPKIAPGSIPFCKLKKVFHVVTS